MARINVEDEFWVDPRLTSLTLKVKEKTTAVGMVITAWRLAQHYWRDGKKLIPEKSWKGCGLGEELFETGFAERTPNGIYVSGTEKHFQWYHDGLHQRSQAGKRSAEIRKKKYGTCQPQAQKPRTNAERTPNGIEPSSSSSSSSSKYKTLDQKSLALPSPSAPVFDFSLAYELYPRKVGKKAGLAKLAKLIKTPRDFECLLTKISEFAIKHKDTEPKYIPHFSTYVNQERWHDADEESSKQIVEWEDGTRTLVDKKHEPTTKIIWDEDNQ